MASKKMAAAAVLLLLITVLLCSAVTTSHGARPHPTSSENLPSMEPQNNEGLDAEVLDGDCEGIGEEECLMRRVLVAHTDYIYTQKKNP